ncbi:hypothetical protein ACF0H5_012400 [Mactra antiquata]
MEQKSMLKYFIVVLVTSHNTVFIQATYYLYHNRTSWNESHCPLATPEIQFDEEKKAFIVKDANSLNEDMYGVWVGYYQCVVEFDFLGCIKENDIKDIGASSSDPGQCYTWRKDISIFAVSNTTYYCLKDDLSNIVFNTKLPDYTRKCSDSLPVTCGGPNGHQNKLNREDFQCNSRNPGILEYDSASKLHKITFDDHGVGKTKRRQALCEEGTETTRKKPTTPVAKSRATVTSKVIETTATTVPVKDIEHSPTPTTAKSRATVTSKVIETTATIAPVTDDEHLTTPTTAKSRATVTSKVIETTATTVPVTDDEHLTTPTTVKSRATVTSKVIETTATTVPVTDIEHSTIGIEQTKSKEYGIPIGVGVTVAVIIIVIILVIVLIKRRMCFFRDNTNKASTRSHDIDLTGNNQDYAVVDERTGNDAYNYPEGEIPAFHSIDNDNSDYYEIDTHFRSVAVQQKKICTADDNIYNTTNERQTIASSDDGNIYNKLESDDNTYDTTRSGATKTGANRELTSDDTYNTVHGVNDDTYDSTCRQQVKPDMYKTSSPQDDTYSHVPK